MRNTRTILGKKARQAITKGVNSVYEPVRRTFGPEGKSALLYGTFGREPRITNDGYTVAETQEPKNPHVNLAAQIFKDACKRTNQKVGDGTTTTAIIGGKLYNDVNKLLVDSDTLVVGSNTAKIGQVKLKNDILKKSDKIKAQIKKVAKKVKTLGELERIATISVRDEELGKIIAEMAWEVGKDGYIDTVEGHKGEVETEVIKGMRFPAKIVAKGFVNKPERFEMVLEDSACLVTNYKLDNVQQLKAVLDGLVQKNPKIAIFAPDFGQEVIEFLFNSTYSLVQTKDGAARQKGQYDLFPVKVPSFRTEQFDDLSVYCGASFINKDVGMSLEAVVLSDLGFFDKLVVKDTENKEDATLVGGRGTKGKQGDITAVQERVDMLKGQLVETKEDQFKKLLERRIASIASAVGIVRVGASSRAETYYKKLKIEDAVYACKSALRSGYVIGGGVCLKELADKLPDTDILKGALIEPYNQIQNSVEGGVKITEDILDPADSIYYAVDHATSVVANLISTDILTAEIDIPAPEEGSLAIAKAMMLDQARQRIKDGLIKAGEEEMWLDGYDGMSEEDYAYVNDMN